MGVDRKKVDGPVIGHRVKRLHDLHMNWSDFFLLLTNQEMQLRDEASPHGMASPLYPHH